jgi:hypothetical protein
VSAVCAAVQLECPTCSPTEAASTIQYLHSSAAVSGQRSAVSGQRSARCSTGAAPAGESVLRGEWSAARGGMRDSPRRCKLQVEVARWLLSFKLSRRCSEGIRRCSEGIRRCSEGIRRRGSSVAPLACAVFQTVLSNGSFKRSACPPVSDAFADGHGTRNRTCNADRPHPALAHTYHMPPSHTSHLTLPSSGPSTCKAAAG